jgi:phosphoglycerate kinase
VAFAGRLLAQAKTSGAKIVLPIDWIWGDNPKQNGQGQAILDIGRKTSALFAQEIKKAQTIVWNGPMGMAEDRRYSVGTEMVFEAIAANTRAYTVLGGGDTLAALHNESLLSSIDHVSTGGGAMLALLEAGTLVGIEMLKG